MRRNAELLGVRAQIWTLLLLGVSSTFVATQFWPERVEVERTTFLNQPQAAGSSIRPIVHSRHASVLHVNDLAERQNAAILQRLSDPDSNVRLKTLEQLETLELPRSESVPLLIVCLADADPRVRAFAALRLGSLSTAASEAVPALKHLVQTDPDKTVRSRAKDALFNIRLYDYSIIKNAM